MNIIKSNYIYLKKSFFEESITFGKDCFNAKKVLFSYQIFINEKKVIKSLTAFHNNWWRFAVSVARILLGRKGSTEQWEEIWKYTGRRFVPLVNCQQIDWIFLVKGFCWVLQSVEYFSKKQALLWHIWRKVEGIFEKVQ